MDYVDDVAMNAFTQGQSTAMTAIIQNDVSRNQLTSTLNLARTGVMYYEFPDPEFSSQPFGVNQPMIFPWSTLGIPMWPITQGDTMQFHNFSLGVGPPPYPNTLFEWSFPGAQPDTSNAPNPMVTYTDTGWHPVMLKVTDPFGQCIMWKPQYIYVQPIECHMIAAWQTLNVKANSARLWWQQEPVHYRYQIKGRSQNNPNWVTINLPPGHPPVKDVYGLQPWTGYIWQVRAFCDAGMVSSSPWTPLDGFQTLCAAPDTTAAITINSNSVRLGWNAVGSADHYRLRIREISSSNWFIIKPIYGTRRWVYGLQPNTTYVYQVKTMCDTFEEAGSVWTPFAGFTTTGTGTRLGEDTPDVSVSPNPNTGSFEISLSKPCEDGFIRIIDLSGKLVEEVFCQVQSTYQFEGYQPGLYLFEVWNEGNSTAVGKIGVR